MSRFIPSSKLRSLLPNPEEPFVHRDLSWLQFNTRVLAEARLKSNPLLERLKFLSISSSNLDEFFMIRMAALGRSIAQELRGQDPEHLTRLRRIRTIILGNVARLATRQASALQGLQDELENAGIVIHTSPGDIARSVFEERVLPELPAPIPAAASSFLQIDNLALAAVFGNNERHAQMLLIPKKLRPVLTHFETETGKIHFFFLDRLLEAYAAESYGMRARPVLLRLTRDADLSVDLEEEDPESIPDAVLSRLKRRERGRPVRLQCRGALSPELLALVQRALKFGSQQVFEMPQTMCLHGLWSALNEVPDSIRSKPGLTYVPLKARIPDNFTKTESIFDSIRSRDLFLHHPYDAFDAYVNWIRAACTDEHTTMIQQTVYRMDALSPVIDALKEAAKRKRVRVVIELRARFDELNNLKLAEELRRAGVEVTFGFGNLKLHAKIALVSRREGGKERLYTHLSTGNYNAVTARQYTDMAILTAHPEIGEDARHFFDAVCSNQIPSSFRRLVPAPTKLHRRILQLIDSEIAAARQGKPARIVTKVNTLVDHAVIANLYRASQAGVRIDLIVRGACSLVPGIPGLSENIRVVSIVDRFLEHSRIYYFENAQAMYLSSADWMPRNFFSRLEVAFPVLDKRLYAYIEQVVLPTYLGDTAKARELSPDGQWRRPTQTNQNFLRSQFYFEELAARGYEGTPLSSYEKKDIPKNTPTDSHSARAPL